MSTFDHADAAGIAKRVREGRARRGCTTSKRRGHPEKALGIPFLHSIGKV